MYINLLMHQAVECLSQHLNITPEQASCMFDLGQITVQICEGVPSTITLIEGMNFYFLVENEDGTVSVKYSQPL